MNIDYKKKYIKYKTKFYDIKGAGIDNNYLNITPQTMIKFLNNKKKKLL